MPVAQAIVFNIVDERGTVAIVKLGADHHLVVDEAVMFCLFSLSLVMSSEVRDSAVAVYGSSAGVVDDDLDPRPGVVLLQWLNLDRYGVGFAGFIDADYGEGIVGSWTSWVAWDFFRWFVGIRRTDDHTPGRVVQTWDTGFFLSLICAACERWTLGQRFFTDRVFRLF